MSDFDFAADRGKAEEKRGRLLASPGWLNIHELSLEFPGSLHDQENVPDTRAALARIAVVEYLPVRQDGTLEECQTLYQFAMKNKRCRRNACQPAFPAARGRLENELQQRTPTELAGLQESLSDCSDNRCESPAPAAAARHWNRAALVASRIACPGADQKLRYFSNCQTADAETRQAQPFHH